MTARKDNSAMSARVPLPKTNTGVDGFDEITGGGLPTGRPTLVTGPAGSGKSLFALQFLVSGATRFDEPGVFVAFEESRADLVANTGSLGFDLEGLERDGKLVIDAIHLEPSTIIESGGFDLEALMVRLARAVDKVDAKRVAIDTAEALFNAFSMNPALIRAELRRLFRWLKERGLTCVITGELGATRTPQHGIEEFLADCVILLDNRVVDEVSTRRLRVAKYRGTVHGNNEYPFLIGADGLQVLPITSMSTTRQVSLERMSTGLPDLDEMLGGQGIFKESTVLVSGQAGTGKSILAASLAVAACARGERVLYFSFEESEPSIVRSMTSIGLDLAHWMEQGLLKIHNEAPTTLGLEAHLAVMQHMVREYAPALVVIDSLSSLARLGAAVDASAVVARQVDYLQASGVTAVLTWFAPEPHGGFGAIQHVGSVVDTWIEVITLEGGSERNRGLYVLKSRGMAHSNQIREFLITSDGIRLIPVYVGPDGVLTGSARRAAESAERIFAAELDHEATLTSELETRRSEVKEHLLALRANLVAEQDLTRQLIEMTQTRRAALSAARVEQGRTRTAASNAEPTGSGAAP